MTAYQSINRICTVASRQPRRIAQLRVGIGIWLLLLMAVLRQHGSWRPLGVAAGSGNSGALGMGLFPIPDRTPTGDQPAPKAAVGAPRPPSGSRVPTKRRHLHRRRGSPPHPA
jgi:hypothetical protein